MEKVTKGLRKQYPVLRLYKSDIENIFNLIKGHSGEVEIIAEGFKLDDFSELNKLNKKQIIDFEIRAHNPYFSVDFSKDAVIIYLSDEDDIGQRGLAEKVNEILSQRRSPLRFLASWWIYVPLVIIYLISINLIENRTTHVIAFFGFISLTILWGYWGYSINEKKHSIIYLYDPSAAPGFFKRNKDSILVAILGAIFGGIVTLIVTTLLKKN